MKNQEVSVPGIKGVILTCPSCLTSCYFLHWFSKKAVNQTNSFTHLYSTPLYPFSFLLRFLAKKRKKDLGPSGFNPIGRDVHLHRWTRILSFGCCSSVTESCLTLCDLMDCSTPGSPVLHYLLEFAQNHVHWVVMLFNHLILCRRFSFSYRKAENLWKIHL